MIKPIIYGSVCSGIEAATIAWHPLGWKASFFSEIEKLPCSVLKHHYPETPLHGDFTTIQNNQYDAIDLLVGRTTCQAFSVAGLRKGLDDPRGNLTLSFIGLAERLHPKWIVWENVPGVLSIDRGRAFGAFLGGLAKIGYGFAYRILDAQYFGVPQRRRRVFVVGYLGDYRRAAAVLFEREGLCRHSPPRREARKENASNARGCTSVSSGHGYWSQSDVAGTIRSQDSVTKCDTLYVPPVAGTLDKGIPARGAGNGDGVQHEVSYTLTKNDKHGVAYNLSGSSKRDFHAKETEVSHCLGIAVPTFCPTKQQSITQIVEPIAFDAYNQTTSEVSQTIGTSASDINHVGGVLQSMQVRRLTPTECERLQGFPDGYTDIKLGGKPTPDGSRYKALGNSMAVPVMNWIGRRIQMMEELIQTNQI